MKPENFRVSLLFLVLLGSASATLAQETILRGRELNEKISSRR